MRQQFGAALLVPRVIADLSEAATLQFVDLLTATVSRRAMRWAEVWRPRFVSRTAFQARAFTPPISRVLPEPGAAARLS